MRPLPLRLRPPAPSSSPPHPRYQSLASPAAVVDLPLAVPPPQLGSTRPHPTTPAPHSHPAHPPPPAKAQSSPPTIHHYKSDLTHVRSRAATTTTTTPRPNTNILNPHPLATTSLSTHSSISVKPQPAKFSLIKTLPIPPQSYFKRERRNHKHLLSGGGLSGAPIPLLLPSYDIVAGHLFQRRGGKERVRENEYIPLKIRRPGVEARIGWVLMDGDGKRGKKVEPERTVKTKKSRKRKDQEGLRIRWQMGDPKAPVLGMGTGVAVMGKGGEESVVEDKQPQPPVKTEEKISQQGEEDGASGLFSKDPPSPRGAGMQGTTAATTTTTTPPQGHPHSPFTPLPIDPPRTPPTTRAGLDPSSSLHIRRVRASSRPGNEKLITLYEVHTPPPPPPVSPSGLRLPTIQLDESTPSGSGRANVIVDHLSLSQVEFRSTPRERYQRPRHEGVTIRRCATRNDDLETPSPELTVSEDVHPPVKPDPEHHQHLTHISIPTWKLYPSSTLLNPPSNPAPHLFTPHKPPLRPPTSIRLFTQTWSSGLTPISHLPRPQPEEPKHRRLAAAAHKKVQYLLENAEQVGELKMVRLQGGYKEGKNGKREKMAEVGVVVGEGDQVVRLNKRERRALMKEVGELERAMKVEGSEGGREKGGWLEKFLEG